jgi:dihydrolipoamide dehydrogenase
MKRAGAVVIATSASAVVPADWSARLGDRILTVETLFEQERLPGSVAVIGLGPIGVEIGQALHRLGVQVVGIEASQTIARLEYPVVNQAAVDILRREFPVWLGHAAVVEREGDGGRVSAGGQEVLVQSVFVSMGWGPNVAGLGLENVGCPLDERGVPLFDPRTLQVGRHPIYLSGDATGGIANLLPRAAWPATTLAMRRPAL